MFEKWRIKEHMEVVDSAGQHVGTVDEVEDGGEKGRIKLTRSDASDGAHHYLDIENVDRIEDNRVYLKAGTPLPERETTSATAGYTGSRAGTMLPGDDTAPFGTSGHGTGMGGSGSGVEN